MTNKPNSGGIYPTKRYATVVLDPPWSHLQRGHLGAVKHYSLMTTDEIARLPVPELLDENAHVWIWATTASKWDAKRIAENIWGLTFRSELIWDKDRTGLGNYLRGSHETLYLFTKGRAPILFKGQRDVVRAPLTDHSHKPEEIMVAIQRCSPGPYLELFARRRFPGFDHWGNEVPGGSDIHIKGFDVPMYSARALDPISGSHDQWADGVIRKANP
ncbi:MT-A70 family methyltransferase [Subtercola frigoramans]|uniref:N6-adenosine-specific RNA methylase IME4 n=1 Tax=Subtercola frigoramans TaxID=120298 RepID=A0ABS2L5Z1_9MICO|nr:MT-A70 family methyltransferase [Subtercola frigoramans]MBM7472498.1 N6-adenosine-specific RNA methylase IME4 [Subtercola frigoramans]